MRLTPLLAACSVVATLLPPSPARADAGHDHGDAAAAAATGRAWPRFAAVSESFELVGVLQGRRITLYLDRAADNAPVTGARIELEVAGAKLTAQPHEDAYEAVLAAEPKPGVLPITATITAGPEVDLLAGELDLHEAVPADDLAHRRSWLAIAGWAAGAVAAAALLVVIGRRLAAGRQRRTGAPA